VSKILLKVENAGAEKLWKYIIAYRRMISQASQTSQTSKQNSVIMGLTPAAEQSKPLAKRKRNLKNSV
jgi:hypothetical protein